MFETNMEKINKCMDAYGFLAAWMELISLIRLPWKVFMKIDSVYFSIHLCAFTEVSSPSYIQPNTVWWRHQCRSSSLERGVSFWHQQLPTYRTWSQSKEHHNVLYNPAASYTTYSIKKCCTVTSLLSLLFYRPKWSPHCFW